MRRWLIVIDDPDSDFTLPEELESWLKGNLEDDSSSFKIARVQRGGLLADKVMAELPPVRHKLMGRGR